MAVNTGGTHQINIEAALELWHQHRNWRTVAEHMPAGANGHRWTQQAIYFAVWKTNRLPIERKRVGGSKHDLDDRMLGAIWTPPLPRPMKVIPDYRTNTARPA
jgi:hypothetical protein